MSNVNNFLELSETLKRNIVKLGESHKFKEINACMLYTEDLDNWIKSCGDFNDMLLVKEAQDECVKAIFLCTQGLYKEAIMSLRQFLEHLLFAIFLSVNDYKYRLWRVGEYDMSWSRIVDEQEGIFGKRFIRVYGKGIDEGRSIELMNVARNVYRECSEFVHGNSSKLVNLPDNLEYDECMFNKFIDCFGSIKYITSIALFIRFRDILDNKEVLEKLEPIIVNNLGSMVEVQFLYGGEKI